MSRRLVVLLAEFPEHPVLAQLMAICSRCLGLPAASTPLKTALTGLELLLARAQVGLQGWGCCRRATTAATKRLNACCLVALQPAPTRAACVGVGMGPK